MKAIKLLLVLFIIGTIQSYAGGVKSIEVANGIIQIKSSNKTKVAYTIDDEKQNLSSKDTHMLVYGLDLYTNGVEKQYCLRMGVRNIPVGIFHGKVPVAYIPSYAKILLKMVDDSVIELTSVLNSIESETDYCANFLLQENTLYKIFDGVKKIRLEIINFDQKTGIVKKEFRDVNYEKDKFGRDIKEWYDDINKEYAKKGDELLKKIKVSTITNIKEGF